MVELSATTTARSSSSLASIARSVPTTRTRLNVMSGGRRRYTGNGGVSPTRRPPTGSRPRRVPFAVYWLVDGSPLIAVGSVTVGLLSPSALRRVAEAGDDDTIDV